jgi:uncharacterized protein
MIIDFHTHVFPPEIKHNRDEYVALDPVFKELYSNPKAKIVTADDLVANMDIQGIDKSVILNISWSHANLCEFTNNYIFESVAKHPNRLIGFCMVTFESPENAIRELERCLANGVRGVGEIRPPVGLFMRPLLKPLVQFLVDNRLVLLTHSSEPVGHEYSGKGHITPEVLYSFIKAYPDLKLVCAHWGGGLPFYSLMPEVDKALGNVYFDTAASPYLYRPQVYSQICDLIGSEKILFGSDYPLMPPTRLISEIHSLDLPGDFCNNIYSRNALELLGFLD